MKKKMIILLVVFMLVLLQAGCGVKTTSGEPVEDPVVSQDESPGDENSGESGAGSGTVYFSELKYNSETGTLHYVIVNDTDETVTFGGDILLEKRAIDGLWVDVMPLQWNEGEVINGPMIGIYQNGPGESMEGDLVVSATFGELSDGDYRISMQIGTERGAETILGGFTVAPMK